MSASLSFEEFQALFGDGNLLLKAEVEEGDQWITVNGNHILIGAKGEVKAGNPKALGQGTVVGQVSDRVARAMKHYVPTNTNEQRLADKTEVEVSKALGIARTGDNLPFDLHEKGIGVEVKTLMKTKNDKITMHRDAIERKLKVAKANKLKVFTVVVDKRGGGRPKYYVAKGVGSFRIGGMNKMGSLKELKKFIRG